MLAITSSMCCSFQYCASASATSGRSVTPARSSSPIAAVDHRVQVREIGRGVGDLRGDHDLALIHDRLGVIALHVSVVGLHPLGVGVGHAHHPLGHLGRDPLLRAATEPPALLVATVLAVILIRPVGRDLRVTLGLEALTREQQPILARAGNRIRVLPAALLELAVRFPRPTLASLVARHDPLGIELEPILLTRHRLRLGLGLLIFGASAARRSRA